MLGQKLSELEARNAEAEVRIAMLTNELAKARRR